MSEIVDQLAELTGFRDRELLDVTLVNAVRDLLVPRSVAIYRSIGEAGNERWSTRARILAGDAVATADPNWVELDQLPLRSADPARLAAFQEQNVVQVEALGADGARRTLFPISSDRDSLGVLEVESEGVLDERDKRLIASILRIYRNFLGLLDYSERDTLTGLLNRKTFDESFMRAAADPLALTRQEADGRRQVGGLNAHWLGVIDIDNFKRVNDSHGHLIGDEVLLLLSRLMRSGFRFHDRLYRFGGEEFVVLMRCADGVAAVQAFERLRASVEQYPFPQVGRITVSIGVTQLRTGDTPAGAFERADRSVYFAKQHGRNQVRNHAELVAAGDLSDDAAKVGDVELF